MRVAISGPLGCVSLQWCYNFIGAEHKHNC